MVFSDRDLCKLGTIQCVGYGSGSGETSDENDYEEIKDSDEDLSESELPVHDKQDEPSRGEEDEDAELDMMKAMGLPISFVRL